MPCDSLSNSNLHIVFRDSVFIDFFIYIYINNVTFDADSKAMRDEPKCLKSSGQIKCNNEFILSMYSYII